jgi:hypothetical protein
MGTRKRGAKLLSPDEQAILKAQRAREAAVPPLDAPPAPATDPPPPDPIPATYIGATGPLPLVQTIEGFATAKLLAETAARTAQEAGILGTKTTLAQAVAIILRGLEMGIPPFKALTEMYLSPNDAGGMDFVQEAGLMRAQVAASGLGVIEPILMQCTADAATVRIIRHDQLGRREDWFTYTIEDAQKDGLLLHSPKWQSGAYRRELLIARATGGAKRGYFEDVSGPRFTTHELGGDGGTTAFADGLRSDPHSKAPPSSPPTDTSAPAAPVSGAGHVPADDAGAPSPVPPAGGTTPPGPAAAPSAPPPAPPPDASRQEKMAYYADLSTHMRRPWTVSVGMSRDPQPVPILTHGAAANQITAILNYTVPGRVKDWPHADEAMRLVIDHLGTLGIDTELLPAPYVFFALTQAEASDILQGLEGWANAGGPAANGSREVEVEAPPNPLHVPQEGQAHSYVQATEFFEAVLRRVVTHATRADVLAMMRSVTGKEFHEMSADELYQAAADVDRLGNNPVVLKNAIDRLRTVGA